MIDICSGNIKRIPALTAFIQLMVIDIKMIFLRYLCYRIMFLNLCTSNSPTKVVIKFSCSNNGPVTKRILAEYGTKVAPGNISIQKHTSSYVTPVSREQV